MASFPKSSRVLLRQNPALWTRTYKTGPPEQTGATFSRPLACINHTGGRRDRGKLPRETVVRGAWCAVRGGWRADSQFVKRFVPNNLLGTRIVTLHLVVVDRDFKLNEVGRHIVELKFSTL
jgi:hypothetical protein